MRRGLRRRRTQGRRRRPLRAYERWETAAALYRASSPWQSPTHRWARALPDLWRWRASPAGIVVAGARLTPRRLAVVDDQRALTFADLEQRTTALARAWRADGVDGATTVGVLALNGALFLEVVMATQKLGANLVLLNSGFAPPQVADVVEREGVDVLVHDDALAPATRAVRGPRLVSQAEVVDAGSSGGGEPIDPPAASGRIVVLTSGTTGRPKGAARGGDGKPLDAASVLTSLPLRSGETTVVAAPLFHGLGLFMVNLTLALRSTVVLRPTFDAQQCLADVAEHGATTLVVVPAMLERILALPRRRLDMCDTSALHTVVCGGSALSGDLAGRFMDRFGNVLYNIYGSTEVAMATVGVPRDLRRAPGTAGRPVPGVTVRVLDGDDRPAAPGVTGRIFVGSSLRFDGYTGGGGKPVVDGLLATGDLGHFDLSGRLFVEGREDEMIISGGENLFPAEVEEVLGTHPDVMEAAAVGVEDAEFGERLRAFVVLRRGAAVDEDDIRRYVRERLARFKVPRDVVFLPALPRTATGKVRKRELSEMGGVPAPPLTDKAVEG